MEQVTSALSALPTPPAEPPLVNNEDILGAAFKALSANDSPALATAKAELVKATQDLEGSSVGVGQAKIAYTNQKALYDGSDGLVGKIQTMWSVIATKQGYDGALALQASCYSNYYAALGATISTVEAELKKMLAAGVDESEQPALNALLKKMQDQKAIAEKDAKAAAEAAEKLGQNLPTERVLEKPTVLPDKYLKYQPEVVPHQHESANPFDPAVAERTERIGARPGQQGSAHGRFHASVRQAQGVGQPTYPASLRDVKFEPPAPAENATDAPAEAAAGADASSFLHPRAARLAPEKAQGSAQAAPASRRPRAWWEAA